MFLNKHCFFGNSKHNIALSDSSEPHLATILFEAKTEGHDMSPIAVNHESRFDVPAFMLTQEEQRTPIKLSNWSNFAPKTESRTSLGQGRMG